MNQNITEERVPIISLLSLNILILFIYLLISFGINVLYGLICLLIFFVIFIPYFFIINTVYEQRKANTPDSNMVIKISARTYRAGRYMEAGARLLGHRHRHRDHLGKVERLNDKYSNRFGGRTKLHRFIKSDMYIKILITFIAALSSMGFMQLYKVFEVPNPQTREEMINPYIIAMGVTLLYSVILSLVSVIPLAVLYIKLKNIVTIP